MTLAINQERPGFSLLERVLHMNWAFVLLVCCPAFVGFLMLYSAAGGNIDPWAKSQMMRFGVGFCLMLTVALIDLRFWMRAAYWCYGLAFIMLVAVELLGATAMGAQRWVAIGPVQLQPSELMKIALILALARYFHGVSFEDIGRIRVFVLPLLLILLPVALVLRQPDLGTAILLVLGGASVLFLAGMRLWKLGLAAAGVIGAVPVAWQFLRDYQKSRVLTFLDPGSDPLGAGYHILQSKIALGSGGVFGKGFMQGSQAHLNFLPEKQTDFIFTMLAEELGLVGALGTLVLYLAIIFFGTIIALRSHNQFGRLLALGVVVTFFLYVFVNVGMVMGLMPVVGVPLPLISYGGSAMLSLLTGFGFVLNVWIYRDLRIGRRAGSPPPRGPS
ncbi:MAG: rod shape-determining protein RodA [Alphaproteobacteria bacterium]|jgi:rod shape determining protein RodA|nr:rod shape-determining protein RodA [Alphaproteobacteria bacterium]